MLDTSTSFKEDLQNAHRLISSVQKEVDRQVLGQDYLKHRLLVTLIAQGHVILEGVPGLAKTLSIKSLAGAIDASFSRIQFTPDLLPSDITGSEIYKPDIQEFSIRQGPVFAHFVLADEINRAPAKVQSALLEVMQEKQASIGDRTISTPLPFFVLATQNPLEQEGTYPLPEAQIDRFMMKLIVGYPDIETERKLLDLIDTRNTSSENRKINKVITIQDLSFIQKVAQQIYVDDKIKDYIVNLVTSTRNANNLLFQGMPKIVELGASPRATISLFHAAQADALLTGSEFVTPQMIKALAPDILRHRIIRTYEAELERISTDEIITRLLDTVPVP